MVPPVPELVCGAASAGVDEVQRMHEGGIPWRWMVSWSRSRGASSMVVASVARVRVMVRYSS